jgi:hypothetical protein
MLQALSLSHDRTNFAVVPDNSKFAELIAYIHRKAVNKELMKSFARPMLSIHVSGTSYRGRSIRLKSVALLEFCEGAFFLRAIGKAHMDEVRDAALGTRSDCPSSYCIPWRVSGATPSTGCSWGPPACEFHPW